MKPRRKGARNFRHIRSAVFRGRRWLITWRKPGRDFDGHCEPPNQHGKHICIGPRLDEKDLLETIIHEGLHASYWELTEDAVDEAARDITKVLWRMGWRLPE